MKKGWALVALTGICTLNFLDRGLMILLLQPIKEDLHLSDTQLGFLTGIGFALFYATLGVPIARWADRGNRVTIASLAIGLWGLTVMACVFARNFTQLVCARVAAAVGESGCMPPTYSLLGDYFPEASERTRAMSIYMLAGPFATLISFMGGGKLGELYGWRMAFLITGIPGLLAAVLLKLTLKDPRSLAVAAGTQVRDRKVPGFGSVLATLWKQRSTRHLSLAIITLFTMGYGMAPWYAAFMMRSHHMQTGELGIWLGLIFGLGGIVGIYGGGYLSRRWFERDDRGQMRLSALTVASLVPFYALFLLVPEKLESLMAMIPLMVVFNFFCGPAFALLQRLVADEMRATTLAVVMLLVNLIGMGIGPQVVGILSDYLAPTMGADSLRYSMLSVSVVALWSAYHFWQVGESVSEDLTDVAIA
jgi:MFS family permease